MNIRHAKKLAPLLAAVLFLMSALPAYAAIDRLYTGPAGGTATTPADNLFRLAGSTREFVLLDSTVTAEVYQYFVLSKNNYGASVFDPDNTAKFDVSDTNNIAYWLNHDFIDPGSTSSVKLEPSIVNHIDFQHQWLTEGGNASTAYAQDFTTTAGVALLSQTEYVQYASQLGYKDNMTAWGWWLRSARGKNVGTNIVLCVPSGGVGETSGAEAKTTNMVRPAFFLKDTFFGTVKLDTSVMGSKVKQVLKDHYSMEQLRVIGYTDRELGLIGFDVPEIVEVKMARTDRVYSPDTVSYSVYFTNNKDHSVHYSIYHQVAGGPLEEQTITVPASQSLVETIVLPPQLNGIHSLHVEVKEGERQVVSFDSTAFAVFPDYGRQFGDDQSLFGVATHYDQSNKTDATDTLLMDRAGIRFIRDGISWNKMEKVKGVFDFTQADKWVNDAVSKGMQIVSLLCFSNPLYNGGQDVKVGPATQEQLDAYVNYVEQVVSRYKGKINTFELWNEPNISFWQPEPNVSDYARLVKAASLSIRKINPDAVIIAGSVANQNGPQYLDDMFLQEVYPYIDAVSFHPYVYPNDPDKSYEAKLKSYTDVTKKYGGWKDQNITEVGWPTSTDARGVNEELQSVYLTKQFLISSANGIRQSAIYDLRDDGTDPAYTEDNFGIVRIDRMPKPALISFQQINRALADAYFVGEMNTGSQVKSYLWKKGQEYVIAAWSLTGGSQSIALTGNLTLTDYMGNPLTTPGSGSSYTVGSSPVYFTGVNPAWAKEQLKVLAVSRHQNWLAEWASVLSAAPALQNQLQDLYANGFGSGTYAEIKALADRYELLGQAIVEEARAGTFTMENAMSMLYAYHLAVKPLEALMQGSQNQPTLTDLSSTAELVNTSSLIQAKLQTISGGSLSFAQEIMRHARDWNVKAAAYLQAGRPEMALAWDQTAGRLARWAAEIAEFEAAEPTNLLLTSYPSKVSLFEGGSASIQAAVTNAREAPLSGKVKLVEAAANRIIAETEVHVEPGDNIQIPFTIRSSDFQLSSASSLDLVLENQNGEALRSKAIPVNIAEKVSFSLKPSGQTMEQLDSITVNLKNLFTDVLSGTVEIVSPQGWTMDASEPYTLNAGENQAVTFSVSSIRNQPLHEYTFEIRVKDSEGNLLKSAILPLSFAVMVKAEQTLTTAGLDGNLDAWKKAYPIYLNPPADPRSAEAWQASNLAAKMYTQWDEDALYVLAQVYDDYLFNNKSGMNIWDGDNVQISIDPLNDKATKYSTDDYEYGFAYTGAGNEVYSWQAATAYGQSYGQKPSEWVQVLRDEAVKLSTYLIRLPSANMTPLQLQEGTVFGFNAAVNDADILNRERLAEFTGGTATSKNPSLYANWRLSGVEPDFSAPTVYSIVIDSLTGGSITASTAAAPANETVELAVVPDSGKQLKAGTLMLSDGTASYPITGSSFIMPAANVTVTAKFEDMPLGPVDPPALPVLTVTAPVFGAVTEGYAQPAAETLVIANIGEGAASILNVVSGTPASFLISGSGASAAPGETIANWTVRPAGGLAAGTHTSVITVTYGIDSSNTAYTAAANVSLTVHAKTTTPETATPDSPTVNGGSHETSTNGARTTEATSVINGKQETIGVAQTTTVYSRVITTVTLDTKLLGQRLEAEGTGVVVSIPVSTDTDEVAGKLTGDLVKKMEDKSAVLEIVTSSASYKIKASELSLLATAKQLGAEQAIAQIVVEVKISKADKAAVRISEQAAAEGGFRLLAEPVSFAVTASYNGKSVKIDRFTGYVERTITLPEPPVAGRIITGIALLPDGSFLPVPTYVWRDGVRNAAVINSLTNSMYAVASRTRTFTDMSGHWAESLISNMSSRMIVDGVADGRFEPDQDITRAEFAAIMLRALGAAPSSDSAAYADVAQTDWYAGYVAAASEYGLVDGYDENRFGPQEKLTREQAMTSIARAMKLTGLEPALTGDNAQALLEGYADRTSISAYARESIAVCLQVRVAEGRTATAIDPASHITRAETTALVYRLLQKSELIGE